jgi:hypothetical protein
LQAGVRAGFRTFINVLMSAEMQKSNMPGMTLLLAVMLSCALVLVEAMSTEMLSTGKLKERGFLVFLRRH